VNLSCVLHLLGRLCTVLAGLLLAPLLVALHDDTLGSDIAHAFLLTSVATFGVGLLLRLSFRLDRDAFQLPEAFATVTGAWIVFTALGALPFLLSGEIPRVVDAYFETMSGATTTGASILADPALLSRPLLLWRACLHFVGGLGIVALSVAILPALGAGGNFLFQAEAAGPEKDKLLPRISQMSKMLWAVYLGLTVANVGSLLLAGMEPFDAICHGFATVSTGGFGTRSDSLASYSATIQWITILFMFLGGMNFVLLLSVVRGRLDHVLRNTEWRTYTVLVLGAAATCAIVRAGEARDGLEPLLRDSMFAVVTLCSTTGFSTVDYDRWPPLLHVLLTFLMFTGACAGSTCGSSKLSRLVLWWKAGLREVRRLLRPSAVFVVKVEERRVPDAVVLKSLAYLVIYLAVWFGSTLGLMLTGLGAETSFSAVLACLGGVGPGFDAVGPTHNYALLTDGAKWLLTACMLLGRLEFFSVLVLLSRNAWRR
jgi:trk system potassium uptake protein TrkH